MAAAARSPFLDLPTETQKHVFSFLSQKDLLTTLTVSPHFFPLACAQLYRVLDFRLTNSDSGDDAGSSMRTAEALQTILASDYNYGQHIKSFRMTMVDDNTQTSAVMSRFLWDKAGFASKTLNTSLLLLIKKATMLESFFWDVPIELSGAVYQALHKIQGLRQLRLRLDVSLSLKLTIHPGPIPASGISNHPPSTSLSWPGLPPLGSSSQFGSLPMPKYRQVKKKKSAVRNFWTGNRELSGFKHLHSLSLLGISSLDYLDEISGCLKSSTASLKSLSLSLSHEMAQRARKTSAAPPPPQDDATSDEDEDELLDPPPPPPAHNPIATAPATTEADVRKEKQAQETILARIFDMEQHNNESKRLERNLVQSTDRPRSKPDPRIHKIMQDVKAMVEALKSADTKGSSEDALTREAIKIVHKATADYLTGNSSSKAQKLLAGKTAGATSSNPPPSSSASFIAGLPKESPAVGEGFGDPFAEEGVGASQGQNDLDPSWLGPFSPENSQLNTDPSAVGANESSPSWLPLAPPNAQNDPSFTGLSSPGIIGTPTGLSPSTPPHPDHHISIPDFPETNGVAVTQVPSSNHETTSVSNHNGTETPSLPIDPAPLQSTLFNNELVHDTLDVDMTHPDEDPTEVIADQEIISDDEDDKNGDSEVADSPSPRKRVRFEASKRAECADNAKPAAAQMTELNSFGDTCPEKEQSPEEAMQAWIREKHGYQLEELKLYWIPMRAAILSRALDLAVLRRITLLNVGSQDGFWMILAGFQSRQGLIGLKSIHTDNVSKSFLKFVKTFSGLTELYLHERVKKNQTDVASTQAKITIKDIRQQALRKHLRTLERLMLKNEMDKDWDLDATTIILLSNKGTNLIELAISLGVLNFHHMMQNLSSLKNLQAIHLLAVRGASGGGLPHLEYLNSVVDNLSHYPIQSRIKYVAVDNMLCQIQRRSSLTTRKFKMARQKRQQAKLTKDKGKGKAKEKEKDTETYIASDASSETDFPDDKDLHDMYAMKVKASVISDMKEVEHIKLFRNEFRAGAL
ncbi:MAG: hypothetical protein Q9179_003636 [Wetmoreana sp. 5 TL-2023]